MAGLAAGTVASAGEGGAPDAAAIRAAGPIRLDGVLDEPSWVLARALSGLVQREPRQGDRPTEETEVRVLFDADNLYLGVFCRDRTPAAIVATQLARDADLEVDDYVLIVLDPFFDQRNGFFFQVNPAGARADGQISNNAEHTSLDWDGIWDVRCRVTKEGWVAEIAIPFKTLRFKPDQTVWGLNVERQVKRRQEKDRWAAARQNVWISNLAEAGRLTGLEGLRQGRGLDIRPFASGGEEDSRGKVKAGVDVFKNLTPNLNAALTAATDFAETEVDERQVNLTRFPLFFPEKRAFFLEGAGVFEIAGLGSTNVDLVPFFSRRIGLLEGREVPILLGGKLSGRQSDYNIGLLDIRTRPSKDEAVAGQNLLALRASRNLFEQSWIGVIATHGNPEGAGGNTLLGADARFATSRFRGGKNLSLDLYYLRSDDAGTVDHAGGFKIDYPNDLFDISLNYKRIGESFRPALGFVPRPGIQKTSLGFAFQPRPGRLGVRQLFFELEPEYVANLGGRVESWRIFTAPVNMRTESGEHLEWNYIPQFEHLDAPFVIQRGIVIPPGSYRWTRYRTEVNTATKRPWVVDFALWWGGFWSGRLRQIEAGLTLKPSTHVALALRTERDDASLAQGRFVTRLISARGDYNFSPNVTWSNLVQYDNESRILGVQSRFRWTLRPGNDLFLVVNRGWFRSPEGPYLPQFDKGSAKLQFTIRL